MSLGEIAYTAFRFADEPWDELPSWLRARWEQAAAKVERAAVERLLEEQKRRAVELGRDW